MKIKNKYLILSAIILLVLVLSSAAGAKTTPEDIMDDISPYNGSIGPGSAFYGIKISIENLGEAFTFNEKGKLEKQMEHAELRLAEMKAELEKKNFDEANRTLELYREKINSTDDRITGIDDSDTGLVNAQKRIIKHQLVLEQLLLSMPGNIGLERALNNSRRLEDKFELKTKVRLEREAGDDRMRIRVQEVGLDETQIETESVGNSTQIKVKVKFISNSTNTDEIKSEILNKIKLSRDDITRLISIGGETEISPTATETPEVTATATPGATVTAGATATPAVTSTAAVTETPEIEDSDQERLKIKIESGRSVSDVEVDLRFTLNTVNKNEIIEGIANKLASLTIGDLQSAQLEVKVRREDRRDDRRGREGEVDDRSGRNNETMDDRGGRNNETMDDRGGRNNETMDDRGRRNGEEGDDSNGGGDGNRGK